MTSFVRNPKVAFAAAATLIALGAGGAVVTLADSGEPKPAASQQAEERAKERGYTDTVTVSVPDPSDPQPALQRPKALPPMIKANKKCTQALNPVRDMIDTIPTGLALDEKQSAKLNKHLNVLNEVCPMESALKFNQQELGPWMNWSAPTKGKTSDGKDVKPQKSSKDKDAKKGEKSKKGSSKSKA